MKRHNARSGFSLIELLVVITIIGIVAAYIVSSIGATGAVARAAATKTTIAKLDSILKQRLDAFYKKSFKNEAKMFASSYALAGNTPATVPDRVAEVFVRKIAFRAEFPQRLEDLYGVDGTPNTADDAYLLSRWLIKTGGVLFPPGHDRKHESAKLLYLAVMDKQDEMTDSINPRHVAYLDQNDKAMDLGAFVDDWGFALRFYNCPTRLVRPGGDGAAISKATFRDTATPLIGLEIPNAAASIPYPTTSPTATDTAEVNVDSDDPARVFFLACSGGYFTSGYQLSQWIPCYRRAPNATGGVSIPAAAAFNDTNYHNLQTYHRPLIISMGEDNDLGLEEPTASGPARLGMPISGKVENIADNITNLQRRT